MRILYWAMIVSLLSSMVARKVHGFPFKTSKDVAATREQLKKSRWMHHPLFPKFCRTKIGEKAERLWLPYYAGIGRGR